MSTKKYKPEQIVHLLRQIEVEIANGKTTPQACRVCPARVRGARRYMTIYWPPANTSAQPPPELIPIPYRKGEQY